MRLSPIVATIAVTALLAPPLAGAESTRVLEASLDGGGEVAVENLAGSMSVVQGEGSTLRVRATVHAESAALAEQVRLERVTSKGVPALRVRYPDSVDEVRYPGGGDYGEHGYDGERYRVRGRSGTLVYADLEVWLPAQAHAKLETHVGRLTASGVSGTLRFDTASGDIRLEGVSGDVRADTGSGNVEVDGAEGRLSCDTGSGNCDVRGMSGNRLTCDTGSGDIDVTDARVATLDADTGSGNVKLLRVDAESVRADTGSGDIELASTGTRLAKVEADTGSGDVTLGLPPDSGFEARFDMASGDAVSRFDDAEPIVRRREVVGYRRGDGRIRIDVDTSSGDVVLAPSRP